MISLKGREIRLCRKMNEESRNRLGIELYLCKSRSGILLPRERLNLGLSRTHAITEILPG